MYDYAIIGGGIVGLATAAALADHLPSARICLLEKESHWAAHQSGHNSGVIHSGIYYKPGSLKASMARAGNASMASFCEQHGIAYDICGKLIVATADEELPRLDALLARGLEHGIPVTKLGAAEVREIEPHVRAVAAVRVPTAGIADYIGVCRQLADHARESGADLQLSTCVGAIRRRSDVVVLDTNKGPITTKFLINCAGLHSDRVAKLDALDPGAKIVPFRGEYYELKPGRRGLVRNLVYPVPNPDFPFLGVHFTRMIDGSVHAGPNAVLAFKREGYRKTDINLRDLGEVLLFPGFWTLAARNMGEGLKEMARSASKRLFLRSLQRLIPEVRLDDLVPAHAGVRAQALKNDGSLVDDFLIVRREHSLHVCNAPSPAATASLEIANEIVKQVEG